MTVLNLDESVSTSATYGQYCACALDFIVPQNSIRRNDSDVDIVVSTIVVSCGSLMLRINTYRRESGRLCRTQHILKKNIVSLGIISNVSFFHTYFNRCKTRLSA